MRSLKSVARERLPMPVFTMLQSAYHRMTGPNEHYAHEYGDRYEFLRKAFTTLRYNRIEGDYAEFGCCGAVTFSMVYKLMSKYPYTLGPFHMWAFDSFEGLPQTACTDDEHPIWQKGDFAISEAEFHKKCRTAGMARSGYTTVPGFYEKTLSPMAEGPRPTKIRLAYIDCDMYSSTQAVMQFLMPRLQHGMILAFDDYYCWSSQVPSGERMGVAEVFGPANADWRLLPYVQYGWAGMSFVVESAKAHNGDHNAHW